MLKVGLVGVGGISGVHIPAWEEMPETELVALCDIRPEQMEQYAGKRCYTDFDEMLAHEQLDILDICLPTYLHADYSIKAMERGIHVLCEKPVSLKPCDVERVYDTAAKHNVCFMIAHVLRFWPEYCVLKEIYDTKKYGALLSGSMSRLGSFPGWSWDDWMRDESRSGFVPFDLHIHDLDFLIYAFGKPTQYIPNRSKRPDQDYMSVTYMYDDFFIHTEASWYASPYPFTAKFLFQFEDAIVANEGGLKIYEKNGTIIDPNAPAEGSGTINLPKTDAYANEIRYFTDCVLSGKKCERVKAQELKDVLDIVVTL